ncbi:MAG: hypothetical protein GYA42_00215 [Syntrophomonadaceae bacterium]|nr:hypothetical protein [Syntrophomonadaceae bacterium]
MDCSRMEILISPFIDGELTPLETGMVSAHLAACPDCRKEYESLKMISSALYQNSEILMAAPAGFKEGLMQRIKEDKKVRPAQYFNWIQKNWKQSAAAAAAAVMIAWGALSVGSAPVMQIAENAPATIQPDNNLSPVNITPDVQNTDQTPVIAQNNRTVSPGSVPTVPSQAYTAPVFMNKERNAVTSILKIKVDDLGVGIRQAQNMAALAQAQTLYMGQQVNTDGVYTILKMTVSAEKASRLSTDLGGLGAVISKDVQQDSLTGRYALKLSEYQNLLAQLSVEKDPVQRTVLIQHLDLLAAQMKDWETQADQETIILWLVK